MSTPAWGSVGRVFISYRREDTGMCALLLHEALTTRFGEDQIFMDVDSIDPGVDYVEAIQQALDACDVSLALIGPQWLTIGGDNGERRLNDPHDKVRQEIEAALARNIAVIPILVDGACMPPRSELPGRLKPLAHRNALELTHSHYAYVRDRLVEVVEQVLRSVTSPGSAPAAEGRPGAPDAPSPTRRPQLTGGAGFPRPGDAYAIHRVAGLAVGTAREMPDTVEKVWLFEELVRTLVMVGDNEKAAAVARDARLAAKRIDDDAKPPALIAAAKLLAWTGQADQAHNLIAAMPAFGVSSGIYGVPARSAMARGFAVAGDADRAVAMVDSLVGCDDERVETLADLAKILADSHRAAAAAGLAAKAVTIADRLRGNKYARAGAQRSAARALALAGDPQQALERADTIENEPYRSMAWCDAVGGFLRIGDPQEAYRVAQLVQDGIHRGLALGLAARAFLDAGDLSMASSVAQLTVEALDMFADDRTRPGLFEAVRIFACAGQLDSAVSLIEQPDADLGRASNLVGGLADTEQRDALRVAVVTGLVDAGDVDQALAVSDSISSVRHKVDAQVAVAKGHVEAGDIDHAAVVAGEALTTALGIRDPVDRTYALCALVQMLHRGAEQ